MEVIRNEYFVSIVRRSTPKDQTIVSIPRSIYTVYLIDTPIALHQMRWNSCQNHNDPQDGVGSRFGRLETTGREA